MTRKALGRGLSALLGERDSEEKEELIEVDLDLIEPNSEQPRVRFGQKELEELAQSIKENGVVQPVVVRRVGEKYQLIAGERRWRAAQIAGLRKIPALVKEVSEDKLLELALVENIQRQELNPMEEARAYKRLIEKFGLTQEVIAKRVGKDRTAIATYLRLLKLPSGIQALVEEGKLTVGHAKAILMLEKDESKWEAARKIIDQKLSVRDAEKLSKKLSESKHTSAERKETKDANIMAAEARLRQHLKTKVTIIPDKKGKGGRIEIEYYNSSELDFLYQRLMRC
ncbi:MAG: ParB/RepB/Spo0J family partition protein [Pyrinomonadaceae bacterium]|nr:ParB/RepB/Spo0J family partition protein [Pyrinomonadaceae bacterium]MCX7639135.1 ParB/RepB/Spo0J family partition protein [Pyrinomonadaceae bacterium]MDW8303644.1 ParB/RepB/Spo0J family partition protein [Acidobacteriota bacterium]